MRGPDDGSERFIFNINRLQSRVCSGCARRDCDLYRWRALECDLHQPWKAALARRDCAIAPDRWATLTGARATCREDVRSEGLVSGQAAPTYPQAFRLLALSAKLPKETPVIGAHPLLDEPTVIVKPENVDQVPNDTLAVRGYGARR